MRPAVHTFTRRVGRRGAALLFFALLDSIYAFSLFNPATEARRSGSVRFVGDLLPLWVWGLMWAAGGLACFVGAFMKSDKWSFAAAIMVKTMWGLLYLGAALVGLERAYLSATIWLCLALWVAIIAGWPEVWDSPQNTAKRQHRPAGQG